MYKNMLQIGKCSNCGKSIMDLTKKGNDKLSENYADHIIELSNGTIMRVGVCANCKLLLVSGKKVEETANNILKNHIEYWNNIKDVKDKEVIIPIDYANFKVTNPNTDAYSFLDKKHNNLIDTNI